MTPRVALLTIGDGRDKLRERTMLSFGRAVYDQPVPCVVVAVDDRAHRLGFCGAIQEGWQRLRERDGFEYVFHLEEDWHFDRRIDLAAMADLLDHHPELAQVALKRGPVNDHERAAGGVVASWPLEYVACQHELPDGSTLDYLEHGLYFTTNPSLYRRSLLDLEWPDAPDCERAFTRLCVGREMRFALLGTHTDGDWITHTGHRTGTGY